MPQDGADEILLFFGPEEGDILTYRTSGPVSDGNVQVFGTSNKKKPKPSK